MLCLENVTQIFGLTMIFNRAHDRLICFEKTQESPAKIDLYERLASRSGKGKAYV